MKGLILIYQKKLKSADSVFICGAQGSGKTYKAQKLSRGDTRLVIWDTMQDFKGQAITDLSVLIHTMKKPCFRVAFRPSFYGLKDAFATFCNVVFAVGRCRVVVDELNRVTMPSWSPPEWQNLTCRARHRGLHVIGCSQRPAGVDKDFLANVTEIYAGRLTYESDVKALRPHLGIDTQKLPRLHDHSFLHWSARK